MQPNATKESSIWERKKKNHAKIKVYGKPVTTVTNGYKAKTALADGA